eukprot:CAMPEP_0176068356 /NCGR_PEP_ID=MMETSP0120_2-20121206/34122_1 /TAXON_ID=160619 /ORGANISM="Kryptoperidinium foliaceum, Strain CCMP 1326" /LENGTH=50 /DNA_ID=CAMNT_0017401977 /DNA_START=48 /DNA_END=197 /DNA_ORIENTATION=+
MAARRITAASAAAWALVACAAEEKKVGHAAPKKQEPEQKHYEAYMEHYLP